MDAASAIGGLLGPHYRSDDRRVLEEKGPGMATPRASGLRDDPTPPLPASMSQVADAAQAGGPDPTPTPAKQAQINQDQALAAGAENVV
jgi:hypothetical protein